MNNIFLCGFMGCGKSTIGLNMAKLENKNFIDLDNYIVENESLSIPEIFDKYGENYFREKEYFYLSKIVNLDHHIIATGGGIFTNPECYNLIKQDDTNKIIYLKVDFSICYNRIKNDSNRPLVKKSEKELLDLYLKRDKVYTLYADTIIN